MHALTLLVRGTLGLTLLVPLITLPEHFLYPFVVPKVLFFRSLVAVMVAAWIALVLVAPERFSPRRSVLNILMSLYLLSFALSTLSGVDRYRSLWDSHERMLGLFTIAHYVAFYFIATTVVREWRSWRALFFASLATSAVVMILASVQKWVSPDFLYNSLRGDPNRVSATLGHPAYLGGLASFTVLIAGYLAIREWRDGRRRLALLLAVGFAGLGLAGMVAAETRGALLDLAAGIGGLTFGYAFVHERGSLPRRLLLIVLVLGTLGAGTLYSLRNWDGLLAVPGLRRFHGVSLERETARTRVMAWDIALEATGDRPLLGWGPSNYYYAFNERYRPEFLTLGFEETWWDDPHNVLVNALATRGAVGFLIYAGLLVAPPVLLWRGFRRGEVDADTACFGGAFVAMHLVNNLFVFENPSSWLYFLLVLAFIGSVLDRTHETSLEDFAKPRAAFVIAGGSALVLVLWLGTVEVARANVSGLEAVLSVRAGRNDEALVAFESSSRRLSPHIDGVRQALADSVLRRFDALAEAKAHAAGLPDATGSRDGPLQAIRRQEEGLLKVAVRAYDELGANASLHPLDVRVPMGRASIALKLSATFTESQLDGVDRVREAERELSKAQSLSPRRQEIQYLLAALKVDGGLRARRALRALRALEAVGDQRAAARLRAQIEDDVKNRGEEAVTLLRASIASEPSIAGGWWRLALVYAFMGETSMARAVVDEAMRLGVVFDGPGGAAVERVLGSP